MFSKAINPIILHQLVYPFIIRLIDAMFILHFVWNISKKNALKRSSHTSNFRKIRKKKTKAIESEEKPLSVF